MWGVQTGGLRASLCGAGRGERVVSSSLDTRGEVGRSGPQKKESVGNRFRGSNPRSKKLCQIKVSLKRPDRAKKNGDRRDKTSVPERDRKGKICGVLGESHRGEKCKDNLWLVKKKRGAWGGVNRLGACCQRRSRYTKGKWNRGTILSRIRTPYLDKGGGRTTPKGKKRVCQVVREKRREGDAGNG